MIYLNQIFMTLNNLENSIYVLIAFLAICALAIVLRIIVCIGYQAQALLFKHHAKDLKSKSEIKNTLSSYLNKIVGDYIRCGDKSVQPNSEMIVTKHILQFSFLGLSYRSLEEFIKGIEQNSIFMGIVLTIVFDEYRYVFAAVTIASFILLKLFSAVFDFEAVKEKLLHDSIEYLEREIGQFYTGDMGTMILRLKNEMAVAILKQSENLSDSIKKLGTDLSGVLRLSIQEMSKSVDKTMERISSIDSELMKPLENWRKALEATAEAQTKFTSLIGKIGDASTNFNNTNNNLKKTLDGYSSMIDVQSAALKEQLSGLDRISNVIQNSSEPLTSAIDVLGAQLKYIERNQSILETSVQKYELALEDVTRKIGDGLGNIMDFHMQASYNTLNKRLEENIKSILNTNNELIHRMQDVLEQVLQQSRSESQAMIKIKEQMDMQFESLKEKL